MTAENVKYLIDTAGLLAFFMLVAIVVIVVIKKI